MTSLRQIEANRLNAQRSTGPRSRRGKLRSRRNALQHGLTAETVIGFEEREAYETLRSDIFCEIAPRTALEKTFAARLVSLLWRLKRAALIETGLLRIQCGILKEQSRTAADGSTSDKFDCVECSRPHLLIRHQTLNGAATVPRHENGMLTPQADEDDAMEVARIFLRLTNLDNGVLEKLGAYEDRLWKRTLETIHALSALKRIPGV